MSTITGNAEFNNANNNGTVEGESSFNGSSENTGTIVGDAYFSDTSANNGTVDGNAGFYDTAVNNGEVTDAAAFLDGAQNNGEIGVECTTAPVLVQHPQTIAGSANNAVFSIVAEDNPWVHVEWGIFLHSGYYSGNTIYHSGLYPDVNSITIANFLGGMPNADQIWKITVNCKLENPFGVVHANEAYLLTGPAAQLTAPPSEFNSSVVNVNEGEPLIFIFSANSAANKVVVGATRGSQMVDPIVFESEFDTSFDVDSLTGRRKIPVGYLNGRPATRLDSGQWWLRITDMIGGSMSESFITVNVTNVDAHPQITQHPQNVEASGGQTITFTIQTNPLTPVTEYLWGTFIMGNTGVIPEIYNPIGINTDTLTITLPNDLPLGPLMLDPDPLAFSCQIKGPRSPAGEAGTQAFLNSNAAGVTIVAPPEE
jgi:hypothetical protein